MFLLQDYSEDSLREKTALMESAVVPLPVDDNFIPQNQTQIATHCLAEPNLQPASNKLDSLQGSVSAADTSFQVSSNEPEATQLENLFSSFFHSLREVHMNDTLNTHGFSVDIDSVNYVKFYKFCNNETVNIEKAVVVKKNRETDVYIHGKNCLQVMNSLKT